MSCLLLLFALIALRLHDLTHVMQPVQHPAFLITACLCHNMRTMPTTPLRHTSVHRPHPLQRRVSMCIKSVWCGLRRSPLSIIFLRSFMPAKLQNGCVRCNGQVWVRVG